MADIKTLWRNQKTEETVTLENIHERAGKFQRRVRLGNALEYIASIVVVAAFGWYAWALPDWMTKLGSALVVVAVFYIVWQLHRRGGAHKLPDSSALGLADFHRRELERRRDVLKTAWRWYLLPVVPGMALMMAGRWYQFHAPGRPLDLDHLIIVLSTVIALLVLGMIRLVHVIGAAKLQRRIDELDKLRSE
ncbi:MAG: hypothetical protein KGJ78_03400 [Alphaproteobacteria bacterium]|nr:hypothetical protein [Alphaproteobacteria bacterium]